MDEIGPEPGRPGTDRTSAAPQLQLLGKSASSTWPACTCCTASPSPGRLSGSRAVSETKLPNGRDGAATADTLWPKHRCTVGVAAFAPAAVPPTMTATEPRITMERRAFTPKLLMTPSFRGLGRSGPRPRDRRGRSSSPPPGPHRDPAQCYP